MAGSFLKPYTREGQLNVWADPYIQVGDQWRRNISAALGRTCVGVLLVSQDFLASDFIQDEELPALLKGAQSGSVILFAIPISASTYEITPLAQYQWARDRLPTLTVEVGSRIGRDDLQADDGADQQGEKQ